MHVDQVLPSFVLHDAIGVHARNVQKALRAQGYESEIFYSNASTDVIDLARPIAQLPRNEPDRILLYHASTGSPLVDLLARTKSPLIVDYHNITPAKYFQQWSPSTAIEVTLGRRQLAELEAHALGAIADSPFNERELVEVGYTNTAVAPLLINLEEQNSSVDQPLLDSLLSKKAETGGPSFLFVGSLSPHKAPHELIAMLAAYRNLYNPHATLTLVGRVFESRYAVALEGYVKALDLGDAVSMTGSLQTQELEAHWRNADIFVCASNHEGFCVPLIEAMSHNLPIVAFRAAAVPETLDGAGILLDDKEPIAFASGVHRVLSDASLRAQTVSAGQTNLLSYGLASATQRFIEGLESVLHGASHSTSGNR